VVGVSLLLVYGSVYFVSRVEAEGVREGMLGWECNCHLYTALCFILLAKWKQEGAGKDMLVLECNCY
jgi:hypothetical protein